MKNKQSALHHSLIRVHRFSFLPSFGKITLAQEVIMPTLTAFALEAAISQRLFFCQSDARPGIALRVGATPFNLDEQYFARNNNFSHRFNLPMNQARIESLNHWFIDSMKRMIHFFNEPMNR
jgi:hypothetical protein